MKKIKNKGISLIVLVITIIVMIILAGSIIISLSNSGIIGKANEAVDTTNLKQVKQAATLAWADAYAGGARDVDTLKDAVEQALEDAKVNITKYEITVTTSGVTVKVKDTTTPPVTEPEDTTLTQLSTPTITISGDILTITDNEANLSYTASFEVYVGEEKKATMTASSTTTFDLTTLELEAGTYSITVKAIAAEDSNIVASESSDAVEYVVAQAVTTLGALVASAGDYGTPVNYSANGVTGWKVFYKQTVQDETTGESEEYVYLIVSERIPNSAIPTKLADSADDGGAGISINGDYVGWIDGMGLPSNAATIQHPTLWLANWSDYETNTNAMCVSYFLDETYWTAFKNTEKYGENVIGAIGTPTAEMFVASWNAKREAKNDTTTYDKKLALVEAGTTGYYVNDITTSDPATSNTTSQSIATTDDLYIWSTSSRTSVWLASPSSYDEYVFLCASWSGNVTYEDSTDMVTRNGLRPVVCLKASTPAYVVGDGETTNIVLAIEE